MLRARVGFVVALVAIEACAAEPQPTSAEIPSESAPAASFVDPQGNLWRLVDADDRRGASPNEATEGIEARGLRAEELAARIDPVLLVGNFAYRLDRPPIELARKLLALRAIEDVSGPAATAAAPGPEALARVVAQDGRINVRDNTIYPHRAVIFHSCTATLIGPSTAITAAHCLHDGTRLLPPKWWAAGVDSQDANPNSYDPIAALTGAPYPQASAVGLHGCYAAIISASWLQGRRGTEDDFAILEFSRGYWQPARGPCTIAGNFRDRPGDDLGWWGLWAAGASDLQGQAVFLEGYPQGFDHPCPGGNCFYPSLWVGSDTRTMALSATALAHGIDSGDGQSGSPLYRVFHGLPYIVGIHKGSGFSWGFFLSLPNQARRVTPALIHWAEFVSEYSPANGPYPGAYR
jgi:V8-like Glu-specific endopeptidase